jgi:hypothetical protein
MTSGPVRDPPADHLNTPESAALLRSSTTSPLAAGEVRSTDEALPLKNDSTSESKETS